MKHYENVRGDREPDTLEFNGTDNIYIRCNIRQVRVEDLDGEIRTEWEYTEDYLNLYEYQDFMACRPVVPEGQWDEGLQEVARMARYQKWDGAEQSARRKIELGIDVPMNQEWLKTILAYKQAVSDTIYQSGYPSNEPIWPAEPEQPN